MPGLPSPAAGLSNEDIVRLYLDVESESVEKATSSVYKLGVGLEDTKSKMSGFGQSALQTGRVIQDFTQGGIGGILNNIEGLAQALGGGAGLAGVLTIVGVAAFVAKPHLAEFWRTITGAGSNDVPKALEQLSRLNDELKTNRDRLDELKKQQKLTNDELSEYNQRLQNAAMLEEEVDKERKKRQDRDKLKAVKGDEEQAKERAENVMAGLGDQAGGVEAELIASAPKLLDDIQKKLRRATGPERDKLLRQYEAAWNLAKGPTPKTAAEDLVAGAGIRGNEGDIQTILDILPGGSKFRAAFEGGTQANVDAGDRAMADAEEMGDRAHRGSAKFRRAFQQRIDQKKAAEERVDADNLATQFTREKDEKDTREAEHADKKAKREAEHQARLNTPEAINRRQQEALENEAMGYVQRAMPGAFPGPQAAVAKHMVENYQAGLALGHTIEEQIAYAVMQTRTEMTRGIQAGLKRSGQGTESRISP